MHRSAPSSLVVAGILAVAACTDQPRTAPGPTAPPSQPVFALVQCDGDLAKTIAAEAKLNFSGSVLRALDAKFKEIKNACGTFAGTQRAFEYVDIVIDNKGTGTLQRAQNLADHIENVLIYGGVPGALTFIMPPQALLPGGRACVIAPTGLPAGSEVCSTEVYLAAGVRQFNLIGPTPLGYHLYTLHIAGDVPTTSLELLSDGINLNILPSPAPTGFTPAIDFWLCTHDESGGDLGNALNTVAHEKANGQSEVFQRSSAGAGFLCTHGPPPSFASSGGFRGVLEQFLASVKHSLSPQILYAGNEGLGITDPFEHGASLLGGVNLRAFYDDFSTDVPGTQPAIQSTDVGSWAVGPVEAPASITVQTSVGDLADTVAVLNQAQGNCATCPVLNFIGTMANGSGGSVLADVGTYVVSVTMLQNKPSTKNAPMRLLSVNGTEIAQLAYVTESSQRVLKYSGGGAVPTTFTYTSGLNTGATVTWDTGVHQDFVITVNLDANTTTLTVNGDSTSMTNVSFGNVDLAKIAWIFGGIDAGIVAIGKVSITRCVDGPTGAICPP